MTYPASEERAEGTLQQVRVGRADKKEVYDTENAQILVEQSSEIYLEHEIASI